MVYIYASHPCGDRQAVKDIDTWERLSCILHQSPALIKQCPPTPCQKNKTHIGVLMDLQGPKIRISSFKEGKIYLNEGDEFTLDAELDSQAGDKHSVGISYKKLPQEVKKNTILVLDDSYY